MQEILNRFKFAFSFNKRIGPGRYRFMRPHLGFFWFVIGSYGGFWHKRRYCQIFWNTVN